VRSPSADGRNRLAVVHPDLHGSTSLEHPDDERAAGVEDGVGRQLRRDEHQVVDDLLVGRDDAAHELPGACHLAPIGAEAPLPYEVTTHR